MTVAVLRLRAELLVRIRTWLAARGVLEVESPLLSAAGTTDPQIESFTTRYLGPGTPQGRTGYLHTSPEFPMKRLLAAGSGSTFQICRVLRQDELGPRHNPEFTLVVVSGRRRPPRPDGRGAEPGVRCARRAPPARGPRTGELSRRLRGKKGSVTNDSHLSPTPFFLLHTLHA
ncbi:MAG: hypothetical protein B7Z66_03150 [Chromatiales bacterium 21-64-14]|nr:MAG: hypothetical protein B7Z66_03150 [Chromatiales bacterium 21-64-14]HQU15672.1 hypothetical protein [Gammaproteobacteria bacterium]